MPEGEERQIRLSAVGSIPGALWGVRPATSLASMRPGLQDRTPTLWVRSWKMPFSCYLETLVIH